MTAQNTDRPKLPDGFRRVWAASAVSSLGDGVYYSALPLLALSLTRNPTVFGLMSAVTLLPWLLFGLIGGSLVDRWDRRTTMVITDLCRSAILVLAAVAVLNGVLNIAVLIVIGFVLGIGGVLFDSASMAYIPEVIGRDQEALQRANARLQGAQSVTDEFVGPPLGSLLFSLSRAVPFFADGVSFLFSSLMINTLPRSPKRPAQESDEPNPGLLAEARIGASYLLHHKLLLGLAVRPAIGNFAFCGMGAVLVIYAHETLHLSTVGYGALLTAQAFGGLGGAFAAGWFSARLGIGGTLTLTAVVEALALFGAGISGNAYFAGLAFAFLGASMTATSTLGPSVRQAIVPDELMGRVGAAARLVGLSAGPVGALFGGYLASAAGLRAPFLVGSGVLVVMAIVAARLTSNTRIDAALAEAKRAEEARGVGPVPEIV